MIKRRGTLFVVSAPSGAGKTTLCREIRLRLPGIAYSVSVTTRPPRAGEIDGTDFRFVSEPQFRAMLDRGELAEWATVHGNLYGTPAKPLETALADGHDILLDIDTQGARPAPRPLPRGRAGLHRGALVGGARAAAARAPVGRRERDRAAAGPRAPRDRPVAAVRLSDRQSRREGGDRPAGGDRPGRALSHQSPGPQFPDLEVKTDGLPLAGGTRSTRCPTATCSSCSPAKRARQINRGAAARVETRHSQADEHGAARRSPRPRSTTA